MKVKWKEIPLNEIYEFTSGLSKPRAAFGSGYPFLSFKDVFYHIFIPSSLNELVNSTEQERERCSIIRGDVFLTRTSETMDELGMSCVALHDIHNGTFNGFTKRLRPKEVGKVVPEYAGYFFRSPAFRQAVTAMSSMSTRASLNNEMLARLSIILPSLEEQMAIGYLLNALDNKIDLNRRMNETLEAMARAIFKDWFVDFGPVRAKAEGHPPYLAPELWALFPDALDDDDKPVGWEIGKIGDCFHLTMGQSPPGNTYNDKGNGLPFFQGRTDFGFRYPENRIFCTAPTRVAEQDDTLISVRAPVGDINMAWEKCCIGRGVAALRHKSKSVSFTYYSSWVIQKELQQYEHTGTVFGAINKAQFEGLKTVNPQIKIINSFDEYADPIDRRIRANLAESQTLAQLRDVLLPKLMSGEIRLRDAEKIIGESL